MQNEKPKALQILEAVAVAAELTGTELSDVAKGAMVEELAAHDLQTVLNALNRCRRELTGRLTLAAILERIDTGWPSADEVFNAIVEGWRNESLSVVLPRQAQELAGNAHALFFAGDKTGARMAFKSAYDRFAAEAKSRGEAPEWMVEAGTDKAHMTAVTMEAVQAGRLTQQKALAYLPTESTQARHEMLTGQVMTPEERRLGKQQTTKMLGLLGKKMVANG